MRTGPLLIFAGFAILGAAIYIASRNATRTVKSSNLELLAGKLNTLGNALGLKGAGE